MADEQYSGNLGTAETDTRQQCSSQDSTSGAASKSKTDSFTVNSSNADKLTRDDPCGNTTCQGEASEHLEPTSETKESNIHSSPKRGPTLSTSTSSFEALDPHDPNLSHLASLMFSHTSSYLQGELGAVVEDYTLLEQMNRATIAKYADLRQITSSVGRSLDELNSKYLGLQPYLDQIDQIEDSVTKLEAAAYKLDAYARRLEDKFKTLEKK